VHMHLNDRRHDNFGRKAWFQSNKSSSAWVWTCPKEHSRRNARQFSIVVQIYFGVRQEFLRGLEGHAIPQKVGGGRDEKKSLCDPFGENLVKATLSGSGWTYHHNEINGQIHRIIIQSSMVSQMEIEDYLVRKLKGMAVTPNEPVPILSKHLGGYVLDGSKAAGNCK